MLHCRSLWNRCLHNGMVRQTCSFHIKFAAQYIILPSHFVWNCAFTEWNGAPNPAHSTSNRGTVYKVTWYVSVERWIYCKEWCTNPCSFHVELWNSIRDLIIPHGTVHSVSLVSLCLLSRSFRARGFRSGEEALGFGEGAQRRRRYEGQVSSKDLNRTAVRRWCDEIEEFFAVGTKTGSKFIRIGRGGRKLAAAAAGRAGGRKSKI